VSKFFVERPIVAMVISIVMVIVGFISYRSLPVAQFPTITPPEIQIQTTYVGADAVTVEQSVATPIEQQMSGADNMIYMQSINSNNGTMRLLVDFEVATDPNIDHVLAQIRQTQAEPQLPQDVRNYGVIVQKSTRTPLMLFSLYSPTSTFDSVFMANYAYINLVDQLTRVKGIANVAVFGAGPYAMRFWINPDLLAKLQLTFADVIAAIQVQNAVNPAGQLGGPPSSASQELTYALRAQGRLTTPEEFGEIIIRANPDGSTVRLRDIARVDLGAETYSLFGRFDGKPSAIIAVYQLPGSNAVEAGNGVKALMEELKQRFPSGLDYIVSLDTTLPVTAGVRDILVTLFEALALVLLVVFIFLQSWRATLIPLLAVPVSLIGTFVLFPLLGFSVNSLSLFGLVLAIGLVVDDAIVVVEATERNIEQGAPPKEATLKAMASVSSPVIATALILTAVFVPSTFLPGITGGLYRQFALTIAISVLISAFNALSLSPALAAMLLRPKTETRGPLAWFFGRFNRTFSRFTDTYVRVSRRLIRRIWLPALLLIAISLAAVWFATSIPTGFLPDEDQGFVFVNLQLPDAASLQRTDSAARRAEEAILATPGVAHCATVGGFSLLSLVQTTYSAFFFVTFKKWDDRKKPAEQYAAIQRHLNAALSDLPEAIGFSFAPPAIPGVGTAGGVTLMLQDRSGQEIEFLANNTAKFLAEAKKQPELSSVNSTLLAKVPQLFAKVDREKALKQGVPLDGIYGTLQAFMGGYFVNYFNRFGRQWRVFLQADSEFRSREENVGRFYVRNSQGQMVPLSSLLQIEPRFGPEFSVRFNEYRSAQINATAAPGYSSSDAMAALERVFANTMPKEMGFEYSGMSYQEQKAARGVSPAMVYALSLLFVFLILAAQYESWSLPFSVLVSTPVALFGGFLALYLRRRFNSVFEDDVYAQIGMVMLIGLAAKNAILIVAYAKGELERGEALLDATLAGARLRLRPILMTSLAMLLGLAPLWIATGAGALARRILGTVVIGGLFAASFLAIFLIPVAFFGVESVVARLTRRRRT
jgi:HAE1 family hydrophobic/amphiphilic exporter-1